MSEDRPGVATALSELDGGCAGAPTLVSGAAEELELFENQETTPGPLTATLAERRGPGRPAGSPNKRTADLRRFILARYKHPVIAAAEIASLPVDQLATALGCDKRDAVLIQLRCMEFVGPYIEAKMPQRIAIADARSLPEYSLTFGSQGAELRDPAGKAVDLIALAARAKHAMDHRLIEGEAIRSQTDGSQDTAQAAGNSDEQPF